MKNKDNMILGMLCIALAVFIVWNQLMGGWEISVFKLAVAGCCLVVAIDSLKKLHFGGFFFPIAIICIILDDELGISTTRLTTGGILMVAILCTVGMNLLFKNYKWEKKIEKKEEYWGEGHQSNEKSGERMDGEKVRVTSRFGSQIKYIHSDNFQSAYVECKFGAVEVYFDDAVMVGSRAEVTVNVFCGGATLYIPRTWKVVNGISCSFGGVDESGKNISTPDSNCLTLRGYVEFSGLEIVYI